MMTTRAVQEAVYRTSCDRCSAVKTGEDQLDWRMIQVYQGGAPGRPQMDICPRCWKEMELP
jgi:hypothetical protein